MIHQVSKDYTIITRKYLQHITTNYLIEQSNPFQYYLRFNNDPVTFIVHRESILLLLNNSCCCFFVCLFNWLFMMKEILRHNGYWYWWMVNICRKKIFHYLIINTHNILSKPYVLCQNIIHMYPFLSFSHSQQTYFQLFLVYISSPSSIKYFIFFQDNHQTKYQLDYDSPSWFNLWLTKIMIFRPEY